MNQNDQRSELQERIAAELREKAKASGLQEKASLDGVEDVKYLEDTKQTTTLAPAWITELPAFKAGYIFTTHHSPFLVAASNSEIFKDQNVRLNPLVDRESYELVKNGKPIAILDLVVAKSGSETATLFAQKHLDMGIASITAIMAGIDKGIPMKIVCPLQTEGMALVAPKNSPLTGWDSLMKHVKDAGEPFQIDFHSPTSAPKRKVGSVVGRGNLCQRQGGCHDPVSERDRESSVF